jgi:hypothetical protein
MAEDKLRATTLHVPSPDREHIVLTEIPEKPEGWTKHMLFHMNFGGGKGSATYEILDAQGRVTNIGYMYDTRPRHKARGFFIRDLEMDKPLSWLELRRQYAALVAPKEVS